jgi:dTDP-4-amino-4,6-dideoxygalactose transaminase
MSIASIDLQGPPASFGGVPAFPQGLRFVWPALPNADEIADRVRHIVESGTITNGPNVRELEAAAASYLGVRHCVAVSSCTSGLMLVLRAAELTGDVIVPSFTFAATIHAVAWNGLRPLFVDIDPAVLTLSPVDALHAIGVRTSAILATHIFGTPCDVESLTSLCRTNGIRLFFDAAHAFGSTYRGANIGGFGDAEVFSLSPTKVLVAGEGGIIATNDDVLAQRCRIGRDYANPGDYDCRFVGLNARMSEFHAAVALASLEGLDDRIARRNLLATAYEGALAGIPGVSLPHVPEGSTSTYKDFTLLIDAQRFGCDATRLSDALADEGVETRRYYAPPVHTMRAYARTRTAQGPLDNTVKAAQSVITLPLWNEMDVATVTRVAESVRRLQTWFERAGQRSARREIDLRDGAPSLRIDHAAADPHAAAEPTADSINQ